MTATGGLDLGQQVRLLQARHVRLVRVINGVIRRMDSAYISSDRATVEAFAEARNALARAVQQ